LSFKYCIEKTYKLRISTLYENYEYKFREQLNLIIKNCKNLKKIDDTIILEQIQILKNTEPLVFENGLMNLKKNRIKNYKNTKIRISSYGFPEPIEFLKDLDILKLFNDKYLIKTDDTNIPSFKQKVIDVREHEPIEVFDIEFDNVHNFIANGIVTSNCSLYPTTIIAYNLDYSTLVTDDSIPDSKCNVFTWRDCVSCQHDPKVIRKNELTEYIEKEKKIIKTLREKRDNKLNKTNRDKIVEELNRKVEELKPYTEERSKIAKTISKYPMCEERHYRFLKEPKGVIPTILENLLNARKNTRKEIKKHKAEISETEDADAIKNLKLLNNVLDKRQLAYKISANSMYGSWGVRKGYLPFMPGAMCLESNSLISYSYGFTRKIKDLVNTDSLWSYNNGQVISKGNGLIYNGKREVVKITLIDGRTLRCTQDHKIMTTNGWVEAGKLLSKHNWNGNTFSINSDYSKVFVGLELPEDIINEDEKNWKILDYKMDTPNNREKTLAFCRILGFILSDGSISIYKNKYNKKITSCIVSIGTLLDAHIFVRDIKLVTGKEPKITNCERLEIKGNTFIVHIPKILVNQILLLENIPIGKRTHQHYNIP
jgi:intein/homing endonuclease